MNKTLLSAFVGLGVLTVGGAYLVIKKRNLKEETLENDVEEYGEILEDDVEVIEEAI